ncbi:hypothetical protein GGR53DRAFT_481993 [Hypoxylon sp. FL1150]|nr:hypothetical protein GGR53DRAFT_481993 [Hypoxylon sp. FL1150]
MAVSIPSDLLASFPPGRGRERLDFYLGDDGNRLYTVENLTAVTRDESQLRLRVGTDGHGRSIGAIRKPDEPGYIDDHRRDDETFITVRNPNTQQWSLPYIMTKHKFLGITTFRFEVVIGLIIETFEWRASEGQEVRVIHPHPRAHGYKLVRLRKRGPGGGRGGKRDVRQEGETSDGREIVAVWSTVDSRIPEVFWNKKRPFTFQLCGSATTGELGDDFSLVALMTALKIYSIKDPFLNIPPPPIPRHRENVMNLVTLDFIELQR